MFLSTKRKSFLLIAFCLTVLQACGSSQTAENKEVSLGVEAKSKFPFLAKEPEIYQGDLIMSNGKSEDRWFVARKGDKWRYDVFRGAELWSQIRSDKLYYVDHRKKVYWEMSSHDNSNGDPGHFGDLTRIFFKGEEHREFDEVGRENGLIKYKVRENSQSAGEILIYIDAASGIMVRQEFITKTGEKNPESPISFVYEIRNLKLDVDDGVFDIPQEYKKVAAAEIHPRQSEIK